MAADGDASAATSRRWSVLQNHHALILLVLLGVVSHVTLHMHASEVASASRHALALAGLQHQRIAMGSKDLNGEHRSMSTSACSSGGALTVLVLHEHHLKPIGSDLRLLGVVAQLRSLGHTVSLLFRGKTPVEQRSPPTSELAALIGATRSTETVLSATELPPRAPSIYEYADLDSLANLARQGWFDVVLCPLWFWRDPMASTAELLLPTFAFHVASSRRPFVGVLSDDAHSAKAAMMAEWETAEDRKALWQEKARTLPLRQRAVYSLADAVIHISDADSQLERSLFNSTCPRWRVLRMSPRGVRVLANTSTLQQQWPKQQEASTSMANTRDSQSILIGFVGNGVTPTNHLSIQWFLNSVWPVLRKKLPTLRLRLVGYAPDDRPKRLQHRACIAASSSVRCGWAWQTQYAGNEVASGIDELGFISDETMLSELRSWRAMVVPILRSTGVNTKLLPALQVGMPIVLTSVAASPLGIPTDDSVALIADDADAFVTQLLRIQMNPHEMSRLSAAARAHWQHMLDEDASASDLTPLLSMACDILQASPGGRPMPSPIVPVTATSIRADLAAARHNPSTSRCFTGPPPAIFVAMHSAAASEGSVLLVHAAWATLCAYCGLHCVHGRGGRKAAAGWDVLIEHEATYTPEETAAALVSASTKLSTRPLRYVHLPAAQFPAVLSYSTRGGILASVTHGERLRSGLPSALESAGFEQANWASMQLEPLVNGSRGTSVDLSWRSLLVALGVHAIAIDVLMSTFEKLRLQLTSVVLRWQGCYRDRADDRIFAEGPHTLGHTTLACATACIDHPYFALQNGGQCFCGHKLSSSAVNHSQRVANSQCGRVCETEEGKLPLRLCGGGWRNAVYANPVDSFLRHEVGRLMQSSPPPPSLHRSATEDDLPERRHTRKKKVKRGKGGTAKDTVGSELKDGGYSVQSSSKPSQAKGRSLKRAPKGEKGVASKAAAANHKHVHRHRAAGKQ